MPLAACDDNNPETTDSAVVYTAEGSVNAGDVEKSIRSEERRVGKECAI